MTPVRVEQAVFGSFPFWDRGYAILAQSPGCRAAWIEDFRRACERFGERPRDVGAAGGMFAIRLESGPWAVVGVGEVGSDDRGRPGALAFHALFVSPRDYRRLGGMPFGLARHHRRSWGPETRSLESEILEVRDDAGGPGEEARAGPIAEALARGRRVAVESPTPIEPLARAVWAALPARVRARRSLATWAFGVGNRFDLVGVPRRSGPTLDGSYATPDELAAREGPPPVGRRRGVSRRALGMIAASVGLMAAVAAGAWWIGPPGRGRAGEKVSGVKKETGAGLVAEPASIPPDRGRDRGDALDADPELRARVAAGLAELAGRFGVAEPGEELAGASPDALMERIAGGLRYRGPRLSDAERERLRGEPGGARALAWDGHIRHFLADRPLPGDFARGPLRWQLATLAWSFHVELDPRLAPAEVPPALGHALAAEGPVRPGPLAREYPTLADYARFLGRLPRR